jgi:hypothetical protein
MIGMKSPGLDGGVRGYAETGTCSWGRAVRAYYLGGADCLTRSLTRKVVNTSDGAASVGWPRFLNWGRRQASRQASWPWCWPQPHHFPGVGAFAGPSSGRAFLGTTSGFGGFAVQVRMVRLRPLRWPQLLGWKLGPRAAGTAENLKSLERTAAVRELGGPEGPILSQKSAGPVRSNFPGPWERPSKKRVGDHPSYSSLSERPPQPRHDSFDHYFLITAGFAPIFVTLHFPTFATISARCGHLLRAKSVGLFYTLPCDSTGGPEDGLTPASPPYAILRKVFRAGPSKMDPRMGEAIVARKSSGRTGRSADSWQVQRSPHRRDPAYREPRRDIGEPENG